jgi:hypothetical protein
MSDEYRSYFQKEAGLEPVETFEIPERGSEGSLTGRTIIYKRGELGSVWKAIWASKTPEEKKQWLKEKDEERFEKLVDKKKLELERQLESQKERKLKELENKYSSYRKKGYIQKDGSIKIPTLEIKSITEVKPEEIIQEPPIRDIIKAHAEERRLREIEQYKKEVGVGGITELMNPFKP